MTEQSSDPFVVAWDQDAATRLAAAARDAAGWYAEAARRLTRPGDRLAVDVGCGGAGMAIAVATTRPETAVLGLDGSAEVLADARTNLENAGLTDRVHLEQVDLHAGTAGLSSVVSRPADLIWASYVVHHVGDQQRAVDDLAALLAPGGRLALAEGGLRPRGLPWDLGVGEPGLESRLEVAMDRWFAGMRQRLPGSVRMPYGWTEALRRAGLDVVPSWTAVLDKPAPLTGEDREHLVDRLSRNVRRLEEAELLDADDVQAWHRLLDPDDEAWLGRRDDLSEFEVRCVHVGVRPA